MKKIILIALLSLNALGASNELHNAIFSNNLDLVRELATEKSNHTPNKVGLTPFECAISLEKIEIVEIIIEATKGLNLLEFKNTRTVNMAIVHGNLDLVKILVEAGANLESKLKDETSSIQMALHLDKREIHSYLCGLENKRYHNFIISSEEDLVSFQHLTLEKAREITDLESEDFLSLNRGFKKIADCYQHFLSEEAVESGIRALNTSKIRYPRKDEKCLSFKCAIMKITGEFEEEEREDMNVLKRMCEFAKDLGSENGNFTTGCFDTLRLVLLFSLPAQKRQIFLSFLFPLNQILEFMSEKFILLFPVFYLRIPDLVLAKKTLGMTYTLGLWMLRIDTDRYAALSSESGVIIARLNYWQNDMATLFKKGTGRWREAEHLDLGGKKELAIRAFVRKNYEILNSPEQWKLLK